jgi:hypothetical protein
MYVELRRQKVHLEGAGDNAQLCLAEALPMLVRVDVGPVVAAEMVCVCEMYVDSVWRQSVRCMGAAKLTRNGG